MTASVDANTFLSQLRTTLLRVYDMMLANTKSTSSIPEFSGSSGSSSNSFRDWKLNFSSHCSMISRAYECELSSDELTQQDLHTFLPPLMFDPEFTEENPEASETAHQMLNEMILKIRTDVSKKLYHLLVSTTKGDARALILQQCPEPEHKTCENALTVLTTRYQKSDLTERIYLQSQLLAIRAQGGSRVAKIIDELLARVAKLRYDLGNLGQTFEDSTITSLVINALQSAKLLPTVTELILQQGNFECEHVFTMLRDAAVRKDREGHSNNSRSGVVLTTHQISRRKHGSTTSARKKGPPEHRPKTSPSSALFVNGKGRGKPTGTSSKGSKGKGGGKGKGKGNSLACWTCGGPHRQANCPKRNTRPQSNSYVFQVSRSDRQSGSALLLVGHNPPQNSEPASPIQQLPLPLIAQEPLTPSVPMPPLIYDTHNYQALPRHSELPLQRAASTPSVTTDPQLARHMGGMTQTAPHNQVSEHLTYAEAAAAAAVRPAAVHTDSRSQMPAEMLYMQQQPQPNPYYHQYAVQAPPLISSQVPPRQWVHTQFTTNGEAQVTREHIQPSAVPPQMHYNLSTHMHGWGQPVACRLPANETYSATAAHAGNIPASALTQMQRQNSWEKEFVTREASMPPGMDIVDSSGPKQPSPYMLAAQGTNFAGALLAAAPVPKNPQTPQPEAALTQPQYGPCPPQSPRASLNASISLSGLSEL